MAEGNEELRRHGQTLTTTDHNTITKWAEARDGKPATIEGTEHGVHLGVLRIDFPGGAEGGRLHQVDWDEWFRTFDDRDLRFVYQETLKDGSTSNFFRLVSADDD